MDNRNILKVVYDNFNDVVFKPVEKAISKSIDGAMNVLDSVSSLYTNRYYILAAIILIIVFIKKV